MSASIKDVAARAGVAFQTVSKVLNGKGNVSAQTRQRILDAAEELNYIPNTLARGLRAKATLTLGVLAAEFSSPAPTEYLVGIEREARRNGLSIIVTSTDPDATDAKQNLRMLTERRVDGLIVTAPTLDSDPELAEQLAQGPPAVALHHVHGGAISTVISPAETATLPVRRLIQLGHRRIAMITGLAHGFATQLRGAAYRRVLTDHGIAPDPLIEDHGDWHIEGGAAATHRILDRCPDVTAVYAQNDLMAIGALRALHDRGVRVPEDFSVVGCDDHPVAAHIVPSLSTVRIPFAELGELAVRVVLRHIADPDHAPETIVLPAELVERESTAAVR